MTNQAEPNWQVYRQVIGLFNTAYRKAGFQNPELL
tara:strand:- start:81135 stop:81239 length:105 start_codon:yes stop_codon:yes gene_type:complete